MPTAAPCTAATMGFGNARTRRGTSITCSPPSTGPCAIARKSPTSAPALNASPAPVTTTTRQVSSAASASRRPLKAVARATSKAFFFLGR